MSRFNTGNPLGSADPRDRDDNSKNLDEAVNDLNSETWIDRFGVERITIQGALNRLNDIIIAGGQIFESEESGRDAVQDSQYYYSASDDPNISKVLWLRIDSDNSELIAEEPSIEYVGFLGNNEDLIYIGASEYVPESITPKGLIVTGYEKEGGKLLTPSVGDGEVHGYANIAQQSEDLIYIGAGIPPSFVDGKGRVIASSDSLGPSGDIFVTGASDDFYIHFKTPAPGVYIRWRYTRRIDASRLADSWQVNGVDEANIINGSTSSIFQFADAGQLEVAIRRAQDGGSFLIGGYAHGNDELLEDLTLLVDGVFFEPSAIPVNGISCNKLEMFSKSQLFNPDDQTNFALRYTQWAFENGGLILSNRIEIEQAETLDVVYLGMLSLRRVTSDQATQITDSAITSPTYFPVVDVSGEHSWPAESDPETISVWGDRYGGRVEALEGWDRPGRRSWVSSGVNRNKIYFDVTGPLDVSPGDIITAKMKISAYIGVV